MMSAKALNVLAPFGLPFGLQQSATKKRMPQVAAGPRRMRRQAWMQAAKCSQTQGK